jgi:hypothetical protein
MEYEGKTMNVELTEKAPKSDRGGDRSGFRGGKFRSEKKGGFRGRRDDNSGGFRGRRDDSGGGFKRRETKSEDKFNAKRKRK